MKSLIDKIKAAGVVIPSKMIPLDEAEFLDDAHKIAWLIGSIFYYGQMEVETPNEARLVGLLQKHGYYFTREDALIDSMPDALR